MGAREDFMALRRAAQHLQSSKDYALAELYGDAVILTQTALFKRASARELDFIELSKRPFFGEVIDLAWAVIGEARPGGPAAQEYAPVAAERQASEETESTGP